MARPPDLPDFGRPPLDEVLLGIQFAAPPGYQQIRAGEVWALFRDEFPNVQEMPPLTPYFETFGATSVINVGLVVGSQHDRFWFISARGDQLIQFQNDRFLQNWRKIPHLQNEYPRYEIVEKSFRENAQSLEKFFESSFGHSLEINQCEISYINHIVPSTSERLKAEEWLSFFKFGDSSPDDFSLSFRRSIKDSSGNPIGRLSIDAATGSKPDGKEIMSLTITARAAPERRDLASSLEFFRRGREMIVTTFTDVTTDSAHRSWERLK